LTPAIALSVSFVLSAAAFATELEHITVLRDETQYYIVPWLSQLKNRDLILTVREAHARAREQRGHEDPTARAVMLRSRDGGRTWSSKTVVDDQTYRFSTTKDSTVTELSDGSLLLSTYSSAVSPLPAGFPPGELLHYWRWTHEAQWTMRSTDNGTTWTERRIVRVSGLPPISTRTAPIELPDGTLLMAVYDEGPKRSGFDWSRSWLIRSNDKGVTWQNPSLIAEDPEYRRNFEEPSLLRRKNGELVSMIRITAGRSPLWPYEKEGYLWQSNSLDDGRTWSKPVKTVIWGYPAHVLELKDGRLLCTYGYRKKPFGVRACLSRDGGKTWDIQTEIVLRDDGGEWDLGYPTSVELPDGRVLTVYWFNQERLGDPKSETRFIAGTFYRP